MLKWQYRRASVSSNREAGGRGEVRGVRTKRAILEVYDAMAEAMRMGRAYQTIVSPPPADPSVAHRSGGAWSEHAEDGETG